MAVIVPATAYLPLAGGVMTGDLTTSAHIQANGTAPSAIAGAASGGSPPAPVVVNGSNDVAGRITFGTGTTPGAGIQVAVTYAAAWTVPGGGNVHVVVCPINAATQALGLFVSNPTANGFNLACASAPAGSQPSNTYAFSFIAIG